jgi:hypothetical protein
MIFFEPLAFWGLRFFQNDLLYAYTIYSALGLWGLCFSQNGLPYAFTILLSPWPFGAFISLKTIYLMLP